MSRQKRIVVFGASGDVGKIIVEYALANGYAVTAFVHRRKVPLNDPNLKIVSGDIHDKADVEKALRSADIVVCALSSWGTPKKDIQSAAMENIIPVMKKRGIARIVSLTGAEARADGDEFSFIHKVAHFGIGLIGKKVLHDSEKHIEQLDSSGLDWTVIRSPIMLSGTSQKYELTSVRPMPWNMINRRAVARAINDELDQHGKKAVYIKI